MGQIAMAPLYGTDEDAQIGAIRAKLEHDFARILPRPLIDLVWQEERDWQAEEPEEHVDLLVAEMAARDRLRGLAGAPPR